MEVKHVIKQWQGVQITTSPTLRLRWPYGRTVMMTVLFLLLYLVAMELLVRMDPVRFALGVPSLGSEHRQFEQQWARLEEDAAKGMPIDCIMMGDSTVMTDFAPIPFAESYQAQTGEELICYNFGVGALTAVGLSTLAQILSQEYSPQLLIVGVQALNFTVPPEDQGIADLSNLPWAQYKLGIFTPEGWLYEYSHFYRYLTVLGQLITLTIPYQEVMQSASGDEVVLKEGYYPLENPGLFDVSNLPHPKNEHPYIEHYFAALTSFQLLPENLEALDEIMTLNRSTARIILVEMPVPETFYTFFGQDEQDYKTFIETVSQKAAAQDVSFWTMGDSQEIPSSVWFNYNHLNVEGAPIFSHWLGMKLGQEMVTSDP
jgi:hypothetical protein